MNFLSGFVFSETFVFCICFIIFASITYLKWKKLFSKKKYLKENEFQKCESPIEEMLMTALIQKGFDVYAQEPCGVYRIDLSVYNNKRKVAIECDGEAYHSSKEQLEHDRKKDKFLKRNKWIVLRFSGSEIYRDRDRCVQAIERHLYTKKDLKKFKKLVSS